MPSTPNIGSPVQFKPSPSPLTGGDIKRKCHGSVDTVIPKNINSFLQGTQSVVRSGVQQRLSALSTVLDDHKVAAESVFSPGGGREVALNIHKAEHEKILDVQQRLTALSDRSAQKIKRYEGAVQDAKINCDLSLMQSNVHKEDITDLLDDLEDTLFEIYGQCKEIDETVEYREHVFDDDDGFGLDESAKHDSKSLIGTIDELLEDMSNFTLLEEDTEQEFLKDVKETLDDFENELEDLCSLMDEWLAGISGDYQRTGYVDGAVKQWTMELFRLRTEFLEYKEKFDSLYEDRDYELSEHFISRCKLDFLKEDTLIKQQQAQKLLVRSIHAKKAVDVSKIKGADDPIFGDHLELFQELRQKQLAERAIRPLTRPSGRQADIRSFFLKAKKGKDDQAYTALTAELRYIRLKEVAQDILFSITEDVQRRLENLEITDLSKISVVLGRHKKDSLQLLVVPKRDNEPLLVSLVGEARSRNFSKLLYIWTHESNVPDRFELGTLSLNGDKCPYQFFGRKALTVSNPNGAMNLKGIKIDKLFVDIAPDRSETPEAFSLTKQLPSTDRHILEDPNVHKLYMSLAFKCLSLSRKALNIDEDGHNIATVIVGKHGNILNWAVNRIHGGDPTKHAETGSVKAFLSSHAEEQLPDGARVYTTLKSCLMCSGCLIEVLPKTGHVYYGQLDPGKGQQNTVLKQSKLESPLTGSIGIPIGKGDDLYQLLNKTDKGLVNDPNFGDNAGTRLSHPDMISLLNEGGRFIDTYKATSDTERIALGHIRLFLETITATH